MFPMDGNHEEERQLAFAVDPDSLKVLSTGVLVLTVSPEGWTVQVLGALDSVGQVQAGTVPPGQRTAEKIETQRLPADPRSNLSVR